VSIGNILRDKREEKNISIADVAAETRINKKYIQALEDDNYLLIPSQVYAKGFLKAYANFLGLASKDLIGELMNYYKSREEEKKSLSSAPNINKIISMPKILKFKVPEVPKITFNKNIFYIALLSALILLLLIIIYRDVSIYLKKAAVVKANPPATGKVEDMKTAIKKAPEKAATVNIVEKGTVPEGRVEVKLETVGRSWVSVSSGTKELYSETLGPGAKLRFVGREIKVKAGNGGGVNVYVNGNSMGVMGEEGVVVERTYKAAK